MKPAMTKRQRDVYDFIGTFCREHGYSPSYREIMREFDFSTTNSVEIHLTHLEKKGYITRTRRKTRTVRIVEETAC